MRRSSHSTHESARLALRDAGERSLTLNAFPAATRYFVAALELWPENDTERARLLFHLAQSLWHDEDGGEVELEAARDAFAAAGDVEGEAEAEAQLAVIRWHRGDQAGVSVHLDRVAELLPGLPDGRPKATVLSQSARLRALSLDTDEARLGTQALALAEELGLRELQAYTLNNLSVARGYGGDPHGAIELLERAAEIAREERSPELLRILNNLLVAYGRTGDLRLHDDVLAEFERAATELGGASTIRFARGSAIPWTHFIRGRWDLALRAIEGFLAEAETGTAHRLVGSCLILRAVIRLARGDAEGAPADADRAGELAASLDLHARGIDAGPHAMIMLETGRREKASELADQALQVARRDPFSALNPSTMRVFHELGRGQELLEWLAAMPDVPLVLAARLWARGDIRGAADVFASLELAPAAEAVARLAAGRELAEAGRHEEADVELLRAIDLFRPLGARRYLAEAQSLLSSGARARAQPG